MSTPERGSKHTCPECTTKYYDLNRDVVACPKCGAAPPVPAKPRTRASPAKPKRMSYGRFG
jgi:uncharacterized protein (TIGR02300 family)